MAVSLYLGAKHAGVEWGWWAGPTDCGAVAGVDTGGKGVLDALDTVVPPSCDKAALRVLGLSFAGWNAVVSFVLMLVAFRAAARPSPVYENARRIRTETQARCICLPASPVNGAEA